MQTTKGDGSLTEVGSSAALGFECCVLKTAPMPFVPQSAIAVVLDSRGLCYAGLKRCEEEAARLV